MVRYLTNFTAEAIDDFLTTPDGETPAEATPPAAATSTVEPEPVVSTESSVAEPDESSEGTAPPVLMPVDAVPPGKTAKTK